MVGATVGGVVWRGFIVCLCMACCWAVLAFDNDDKGTKRRRDWKVSGDGSRTTSASLNQLAAAETAVDLGMAEFQAAFETSHENNRRDGCAPETIRRMFAARARVLKAGGELRMRLPNDPEAEHRLATRLHRLDRDMLARIETARRRCGAELLHPGPVQDAWYGAWYRAANDDTGGVR